ncbi:unnamed protein product [Closterium sp. NIES-53]
MLALCREHRLEHRTKHIAVCYFLAHELQQRGQLRLAYVASQANTADMFTKALPPAFDAEGRPVKFETWLDDLHLFLQLTAKDDISLYDHALGHATAPAATADSTARSQWQTRDAHARFAIRKSLPIDEREHFGQHKTAQALYTAVVARYSSPASAALGRLSLPYLFPDLASFHTVADLITHLLLTSVLVFCSLIGRCCVSASAAKRVLRYLCSTSGMGLVLGGQSPVVLTGHADASWADDQTTQRSSEGYIFSLGSGSVSWRATRSSSVLGSSCEAEIYAGAMASQELRWLTYLLTDLGEPPRSPPVLYVDNKAMLALCREQRLEHRRKHIALRYFLAHELQQCGQLRLAYVASEANTADVFTKALAPCDHQRFCTQLGLVSVLPHLLTS